MLGPMTSVRVIFPKAMMACHVDFVHHSCCQKGNDGIYLPYVIQPYVLPKGAYSIAKANIIRVCVQSKGDDNMPRPTSFKCVCCPRAMMVCHAQRYATLSVLFKGKDGMLYRFDPTVYTVHEGMIAFNARLCVLPKGDNIIVMPNFVQPCVCSPRLMITCHTQHRPSVYVLQGR